MKKKNKKRPEKEMLNLLTKRDIYFMHCKTAQEFGLLGPVKTFDQKVCNVKLKSGIIEQGKYVVDLRKAETVSGAFDENGNRTMCNESYSEGHYYKQYFDEKGLDYKHEGFEKGVLKSISLKQFNENGKTSVISGYNLQNELTDESKYHYDERGNLIKYETFGPNKNLTETHFITYNEQNKKIEDKRFKADGSISYWFKITYDAHGHEFETTHFNPDGSIKESTKSNLVYDANGKIVGSGGSLYDKEADLYYYDYETDHHGNFTTRVAFYNRIPVFMLLRSYSYYGEEPVIDETEEDEKPPKQFKYNLDDLSDSEVSSQTYYAEKLYEEKAVNLFDMDSEKVRWMAENSNADTFPAVRYYVMVNNDYPSVMLYNYEEYEAIAVLNLLKEEMDASVIYSSSNDQYYWYEDNMTRYTLAFPNKEYLLQAVNISVEDDDQYKVPDFLGSYMDKDYSGYVRISDFQLLRPSLASGRRNEDFERDLEAYLQMCILEEQPEIPEISMIEVTPEGKFTVNAYPVDDDFLIKDLDMHYGYGFSKFHDQLMSRFESETRGLVLFHGVPGTGKTYYIRHLLRKMTQNKKVVIYMPPNMIDHVADPYFMTFLSKQITNYSRQGYFCALLIEDAEPLLASRQTEGRVQGISNLLNMTDGILNDLLKLQIICTFNVKIKELDAALLRPGRLIARKEFKAMTTLDANRLAQQLGVKHHFDKPATIAEVYAKMKNHNTLVHGYGDGEEYPED